MFCRQCGTQLKDDAKFCKNCGASVLKNNPQPPKVEESLKVEELPKVEEPLKVKELPKVEEPLKVEELPKVEEPLKVEELPKVEEPLKVKELSKVEEPSKVEGVPEAKEPAKSSNTMNAMIEKVKDNKQLLIIILGVIALIIVIALGVGIFGKSTSELSDSNDDREEVKIETEADDKNSIADSNEKVVADMKEKVEVETEAETEDKLPEYLYTMMDGQAYEGVVAEILVMDTSSMTENQLMKLDELLKQAIQSNLDSYMTKVEGYVAKTAYTDAFVCMEQARDFVESMEVVSGTAGYIDVVAFEEREKWLYNSYENYVIDLATQYASDMKEMEIDILFQSASVHLTGEAFEKKKENVYYKYAVKKINSMIDGATGAFVSGETSESAMLFVEGIEEKTGNNGVILEYWEFFYTIYRAENGILGWDTTVNDMSYNGYLCEYSNTSELSVDDISHLSRFELYLARFEIYARHGRTFTDSAVQKYFEQFSWYSPSIAPTAFDESLLSDVEKKNRDFILEYEKSMGYRHCR